MAATWSISQMDDYIVGPAGPYEGDSRVIFLIHWQCTDQQTVDEETYHARVHPKLATLYSYRTLYTVG